MQINLGLKAYRRLANFQPEVELVNLVIEKDDSGATTSQVARIMRPALDFKETHGSGATRGVYQENGVFSGDLFKVVGDTLYRNGSAIGTVPGTQLIAWAAGVGYLFIWGDNGIYSYDGTVFGPVAMPDDAAGVPVDIDTLNSYVFVSCSDGSVYWIVPGENTIDPLNFITAESAPDGLLAGRRLQSQIFFFGYNSVEPWELTGNAAAVIQKSVGRQYERGCLSRDTVRRFDNSIVWVGDNGNVYRASNEPEIINDESISERIRKRTGPLSAMTFSFDRHEMWALRIPGQGTFLYDASTKEFCRFLSPGSDLWAPIVSTSDKDATYLAGPDGPTIWSLNPDEGSDEGVPIEWRVTGNVATMGKPVRNDSFAVMVGAEANATIRLRWHDSDEDYPDYYEEIDVRAPADASTFYRLGSITPPYRSFELSGVDGVRIRISQAQTEAWQ